MAARLSGARLSGGDRTDGLIVNDVMPAGSMAAGSVAEKKRRRLLELWRAEGRRKIDGVWAAWFGGRIGFAIQG